MDKKIINTLLNKLSKLFDNDSSAEDAINVLKQKVLELPENIALIFPDINGYSSLK